MVHGSHVIRKNLVSVCYLLLFVLASVNKKQLPTVLKKLSVYPPAYLT